jgi:MFS family permease
MAEAKHTHAEIENASSQVDFEPNNHKAEKADDASSIRSEALGDDLPPGYFYSFQFIGTVTGFALSAISAYIFLLMPTSILTTINADIGESNRDRFASQRTKQHAGPSPYLSWVNIARTLALSFTYTILGRLSDLFGRRWFFIGGNLVALIGIIVCSVAQNIDTLVVGSAVYGVGETVQLSFNVALGELGEFRSPRNDATTD